MHTERRHHPRQPALYQAKYTIDAGTFQDAVGNVSAGGIYIHARRPIAHGQRISLRFPVLAFDRRPRIEGTVVRSQGNGFAVMFDDPIEDRFSREERS